MRERAGGGEASRSRQARNSAASSTGKKARGGTWADIFRVNFTTETATEIVTNDGAFQVSGIDATNHAYVTVAPAPKDQGAITAYVRKIAA